MQYLTQYSAPPPRDAFKPADMARLVEIGIELARAEKSALQTEASAAAWISDDRAIGLAYGAINAGKTVLVAQDEDGYYFAASDAADDIAVRHDAAANTIDWACDDDIYCPTMVDRAVRQHFAGNHDLIHDWEQACEAGHGPNGPVGIDGWVSVRLPEERTMNTLNSILTNGEVENLNRYNDNAAMAAAALIMDCDDRAEALMTLADLGLRWARFAVYSLNSDGDLANGTLIGCYSTRTDAGFNAEPFESYAIADCENRTIDWGHTTTPDSITVMPKGAEA